MTEGRPVAHVVKELGCSRATGYKWLARWRAEGEAGLLDRSSIAHRLPRKTPAAVEEQVCRLRRARKLGPRHRPGELIHVDVKKLGRLRDGGGWRAHGRDSDANRARRNAPPVGFDYVHCAIDDHTRLAYAEIHPDEKADTCAAFLHRAAAWFTAHGITTIERVMTDNALTYRRSRAWRQALHELGAQARFTRRYRPQTNGKAERFNRTLAEEWAYIRPFTNNTERADALPEWLHTYNHHRAHTALADQPPISRVNNGPGHYS